MSKKIIVAIDETNLTILNKILNSLDNNLCMVKIGSVAFNSIGLDALKCAAEKGFDIFLDLKLHDIPNTVYKSVMGLANLPVKMMTVHISGGIQMLKASKEALSGSDIKIFGVTALTSLSDSDTLQIYRSTTTEHVNKMLDMAEIAGLDGVVCSPHELELVSKRESLLSITPGIRLNDLNDDQKRFMTPAEAINLGADFIVIGRPITCADDISIALNEVYQSLN
jgi:orotidine-5'-phosphate decarboxylase